ncbi:cyclohexanecarboxylate-CoA ligase [Lentzea sp. NBRC 105346]|uniref:class I adenylate-forming enzyme family protein n=1 Tax=Lentzea sp. NBRC 105346 TaxID=3032205 RepID=UPI0024A16D87|nr:class I adenylate-forming enzyme family protein [Lentzea sp. NBRC 105346]GLZ31848.1 cyclohexanecarboxylate-CoA ligase [Lentzea sp. NBRC 105346]
MTWVSTNGIAIGDRVPRRLRRQWVEEGHCPDRDLYSLFRERAATRPDRIAVIDDDGAVSYAELDREVRAAAGALTTRGLGARDIIALHLPNGRDAVIAELAVYAIGAVALPLTHPQPDLLERARVSAVLESVPQKGTWRGTEVAPEAPARIFVSSGSEAAPKMVAYSHNAIAGGRGNYLRAIHRGKPFIRDLVLVSLASAFGSFGVPVTLCREGATLVVTRKFEARRALSLIAEHRPTHVFGVPAMLRRIADLSTVEGVRAFVSSGDALPPDTLSFCRARFDAEIINVYGSSDGVNCHTTTPEHGVGRPDPAVCDIRIVDGEIRARGPMTPLSYVAAPELDAAYRTAGGWVRTGDEGRFTPDGVLHVTRRIKRVVVRGGYTISPAEVEQHLHGHPAVAAAACVPVPDPDLGERLCACVTLRPGRPRPSLGQLTAFLAGAGVAAPKLPERLLVLSSLPETGSGKVCHRTLTELAREHCR